MRTNELQHSLDPRIEEVIPKKINGTGNSHQMTFWLNVANKYRESLIYFTRKKGEVSVSINEWLTYFNVQDKALKFEAGTEVIIRIKPVLHTTSDDFKVLDIEKRDCRYKQEIEVFW